MSKGITKFLHYFLGLSQVGSQGFETSVGTARLFSIYSGMNSPLWAGPHAEHPQPISLPILSQPCFRIKALVQP